MKSKELLPLAVPAVRSFLFVAAGLGFATVSGLTLAQGAAYWPVLCVLVNLVTVAGLQVLCAGEKQTFRQLINPERQKTKPSQVLKLSLLMMLVGIGGMLGCSWVFYGGLPEFLAQSLPLPWAIVSLILLPLTIVFAELPLYYGYAYRKLSEEGRNPWFAGIYVIFWYGLQHSFFPLLPDPKYMLFRFLAFMPLMIVILLMYRRSRNLVPLMVGHGIMDLGTGIQILIVSLAV